MNKKLLIALPILALATFGAVFLVSQQKGLKAAPAVNLITFSQWQACSGTTGTPISCKDASTTDEKIACRQASTQVGDLTQGSSQIQPCSDFYNKIYNPHKAEDLINNQGFYSSCYTNSFVLTAAKKSKFFYDKIFSHQYLECASLPF